ncbi:polar amino acid ABC transporter, inner membrane subunit [Candidatus Moduliflexus flocculans]|uniref:Polar amino acid ABC transporter, inner membrane subunit n=1 Tax=Candidatus Moduliflexus flocculans TaxID=1499966 RepID=A0A081BP31_9BACT|nr:polar amino acid ABC transporter, inner membrane subunit [Candidatus Moduliflexus flocculans]
MKASTNLQRFHNRTTYYLSILGYFLLLAAFIGGLYYATRQIDYIWRWYQVPQYFAYKETVEIYVDADGDVKEIRTEGGKTVIQVKDLDGKLVTYDIPSKADVRVSDGDMLSSGDTLASYTKWKPGLLLQGLWLTLKASVYSIFFGIIIGVCGGIARISPNPIFKWTSITYVELVRGSPLMVQMLIWYFVLGTVVNTMLANRGIAQLPPLWFGIASLSFFSGAYITETVRAGIQSIHRGQIEASRSLGMSYVQAMRYVILPQALRRILPPLAGEFIGLIKDSSLLGIIAVRDLTKAAREATTTSLMPFEFYFVCAVLYLSLTFTLSMFVHYLERRMAS